MLSDPRTPVVAAQFTHGDLVLDLVAAPGLDADHLALAFHRGSALRRCAEFVATFPGGSVSIPLHSFDRSGMSVRYDLPLTDLLTLAAAARLQIEVCDERWTLEPVHRSELRRLALLSLFRREQEQPGVGVPSVLSEQAAGDDGTAWWNGPTSEEADAPMVSASIAIGPGERLQVRYAPQQIDAIIFAVDAPEGRYDLANCDASLEVGPALVRLSRHPSQELIWQLPDLSAYFNLGVVDHASISFCTRQVRLDNHLGGLRRHVLLSLLLRAELSADRTTPTIELAPAPPAPRAPPVLPDRIEARPSGEVMEPGAI